MEFGSACHQKLSFKWILNLNITPFDTGGWWSVRSIGEITGMVAIEMQNNSYIHALDSGLFTLGAPHKGKPMHWRDFRI